MIIKLRITLLFSFIIQKLHICSFFWIVYKQMVGYAFIAVDLVIQKQLPELFNTLLVDIINYISCRMLA